MSDTENAERQSEDDIAPCEHAQPAKKARKTKEPKAVKEPKAPKAAKAAKPASDAVVAKPAKAPKAAKPAKEPKQPKPAKEPKAAKTDKPPKEPKQPKPAKEPKADKPAKEPKQPKPKPLDADGNEIVGAKRKRSESDPASAHECMALAVPLMPMDLIEQRLAAQPPEGEKFLLPKSGAGRLCRSIINGIAATTSGKTTTSCTDKEGSNKPQGRFVECGQMSVSKSVVPCMQVIGEDIWNGRFSALKVMCALMGKKTIDRGAVQVYNHILNTAPVELLYHNQLSADAIFDQNVALTQSSMCTDVEADPWPLAAAVDLGFWCNSMGYDDEAERSDLSEENQALCVAAMACKLASDLAKKHPVSEADGEAKWSADVHAAMRERLPDAKSAKDLKDLFPRPFAVHLAEMCGY